MIQIFADTAQNSNGWQDLIAFIAMLVFFGFIMWLMMRD